MRALLTIVLVFGLAVASQAATVTLSVTADTDAKTWQAFAQLDNNTDNDGISAIPLEVTADGGITIESSENKLPQGLNSSFQQWGFTEFRDDGDKGSGIRAGQKTTSLGQIVITDFGFSAGSDTNLSPGLGDTGTINWGVPALIASGTYAGEVGTIYVGTGGSQINLLDEGRNPGNTGGVHAAEAVVEGSVVIPEPSTLVLLGFAGLGLLVARRRR